mmetsp:Transcript_20631/g.47841  ORF Transcript_20631/g.47841 Transcript_20631/m.47841 type:complete len:314 (-) Transcript_20631:115-1056(-)
MTEIESSSQRLLGAKEFFTDCLSTESSADDESYPIADLTTLISAYAVAILSLGFAVALCFRPKPTTTTTTAGGPATETTPLSGAATTTSRLPSSITLTKRSPYKQILPGFFEALGLAYLVSALSATFGFDDAIAGVIFLTLYSLSTALLLGLAFMEYVVYIHYYVLIKAAWTYTFILILLLSIAGGVASLVVEHGTVYMSLALYQAVVVLLNLISLVRQFQRTGRKAHNAIEISAMIFFLAAIATSLVLVPICTSSGGGCDLLCPLPREILSPNAVSHALVLLAVLLYGIAKLKQIKLESVVVVSVDASSITV